MTLTTAGKDWLAINAGVNNCFSPTGVSFVDADGVPFTAGTKDVVIVFIGAHMVGKNDAIIIANTSYNGFKAINGNNDLVYPDATFVYNSDGHVGATLPLYCAPPAQIISVTLTVDTNDCVAPCTVGGTVSWTNNGGSPGTLDPAILVNTIPTSLGTAVTIGIGETRSYTFSLPDLAAGTYTVQASPNAGTAPQTIIVRTPANVISATLTVDTNDCVAPCTVGGAVSWTNNGGIASPPTNLGITVNGTPTTLATGVTINPGATTSVYTFSLPDLAAGTYTVQASPNAGTAPQIITVRTPANVISVTLTVDTNDCVELCTVNGNVSWTNNGGSPGTLDPVILVNTMPTSLGTAVTIGIGETRSYTFSLPYLAAGTYTVQASPNAGTAPQVITVRTPANVISATLTVDTNDCVELCTVGGTVSWTNNGGTASVPTDLSISYNGSSIPVASTMIINPGETTAVYPFTISNLAAGTYTVQASPNTGTLPKTIIVRTPANIVSTGINAIPRVLPCVQSCTVDVSVIWTNNGGTAGSFIPSIKVDDTPISPAQYSSETLAPGAIVTHTFVTDVLTVGSHQICADPNGTCSTVNVFSGPSIAATGITTDKSSCTSPCDVTIDVTWTNTGDVDGTFTPSINIDSMHIPLSLETLTAGTSVTHTFGPITLVAGTYDICADPDSGTCVTVNVLTPANVISATLTVDTNDCVELCTVNGNVSWTNTGGTASAATDLNITVGGTPTLIASAVTINPGEAKSYNFTLPDLAAGIYVVEASPNAGTAPQVITVRTPANVISESLTLSTNSCAEICNVTGSVSWTNNGGIANTPTDLNITVNGTPTLIASAVTINPGETKSYNFTLPDLVANTYTVCASPGTHCQTLVVQQIRVHFTSTPSGATVYVDDNIQSETTPTTVIGLTAETHTYRMTHPDCSDNEITGNFTIAIGDLKEISETFETSVHITSTPSGARIWIDDADKGVNTPSTIVVTTVHHTYKLTKSGYTDFIGEFDITECQRLTIPASITKVQEAGMGLLMVGLIFGTLLMGKKKEKEKEKSIYY